MLIEKNYEVPTTGPNTTMPSLPRSEKSSHSATVSLVESIILENTTVKDQIKHLEAQIDKVRNLSNNLLNQNISLRGVYQERGRDIVKLIQTITLQNDENMNDLQHQSHLTKQLNCETLKQIKHHDSLRRDIILRIAQKKKIILELSEQKGHLQNDQLIKLRARIHNGINTEATDTLKKKFQKQLESSLEIQRDVNNLIVSSVQTKEEIKRMLRQGKPQRIQIDLERQALKEKVVQIEQENRRYIQQLAGDKAQFEKTQEEKIIKEEKYKKIKKELNNSIKLYETHQNSFHQTNNQRQRVKKLLLSSFNNKYNLNQSLQEIKDKKIELQKKVYQKKKQIQNIRNDSLKQRQLSCQSNRQNSLRSMNHIFKSQQNFQKEHQKTEDQIKNITKTIEILEREDTSLSEQIQEYKKLVKSHTNPIIEIQRIQLSLRIRHIR